MLDRRRIIDALHRYRRGELSSADSTADTIIGSPNSRKAAVDRLRALADDVEAKKVGVTCIVESGGELPRYALLIVELVYAE